MTDEHERWAEVVKKCVAGRCRQRKNLGGTAEDQALGDGICDELIHTLGRIRGVRVTARRLHRTEYNNTVRDLLGVDIHPADDFPQDDAGYGFDNIADVLSLSPVLMEKYVSAADKVTRTALFGPPVLKPTLTRLRSDGRRVRDAKTFPGDYDVTGLGLPNAFHAIHRIPVDGEYIIKVALAGLRPAGSEPIDVALWVDDHLTQTIPFDSARSATLNDDRQDFGGQVVEFKTHLAAGDRHLSVAIPRIFEGLPPRYEGRSLPRGRSRRPRSSSAAKRHAGAHRAAPQNVRRHAGRLAKIPMNGVRINTIDIGGPYSQTTGPSRASLQKIYTCGHLTGGHTPMCARRVMTDFASRAFRRPVTARDLAPYLTLVQQVEKEEGSLAEGLAVGIQAILVSPDFCSGSSATGQARGRRSRRTIRSRSTSWRHDCPTSSGPACRTRSFVERRTWGRSALPPS